MCRLRRYGIQADIFCLADVPYKNFAVRKFLTFGRGQVGVKQRLRKDGKRGGKQQSEKKAENKKTKRFIFLHAFS